MEDYLIEILKKSIEKNGEIVITNKHLLNIIKMAIRKEKEDEKRSNMEGCVNEIY